MQKHTYLYQNIPEAATPEADAETADFLVRINQRLQPITQISFRILVWGPALHLDSPVAIKRREIYSVLRQAGHHTIYSEQIPRPPGISQRNFQEAQGQEADLIILLVAIDSDGSIGEMHDFCQHPVLAPKMLLLVPIELQNGYDGVGILWEFDNGGFGKLRWYEPDDITICNVLSFARAYVEARQNFEYRRRKQTCGG